MEPQPAPSPTKALFEIGEVTTSTGAGTILSVLPHLRDQLLDLHRSGNHGSITLQESGENTAAISLRSGIVRSAHDLENLPLIVLTDLDRGKTVIYHSNEVSTETRFREGRFEYFTQYFQSMAEESLAAPVIR